MYNIYILNATIEGEIQAYLVNLMFYRFCVLHLMIVMILMLNLLILVY